MQLSKTGRRKKYGHHSDEELNEEQQKLATDYFPFAMKLAKSYREKFPRYDDILQSEATLGLTRAALNYDPGYNISFATFAYNHIIGGILNIFKSKNFKYRKRAKRLKDGAIIDTINEVTQIDDIDNVKKILSDLPPRYRQACELRFMYGKTPLEIAEIMNCSRSYIHNLHIRSFEILKQMAQSN